MFVSFRFFIFFLLIKLIELKKESLVKCIFSHKALDQSYLRNDTNLRRKRFVLFPEFPLWFDDWRYLNHPKDFRFWISNYYPEKINTTTVRLYIHQILNDINEVLDYKISSIDEALSAEQSNFNYNFFNYEICPTDDPQATIENVTNFETLLIYPRDVIHKNRYRAHGGISLIYPTNSTISNMKFNLHHYFRSYEDFQYDPVIYFCRFNESLCVMDLYAIMLHETLHGFGIEHTERKLPNKKMRAVMHLYASRIMCHDDIRAIRKVYGFDVQRENAKYDDTCRRDFPMNRLQRFMWKIHRLIQFFVFQIGSITSFMSFLLTMIYLILRKRCLNRIDSDLRSSIDSDYSEQSYKKQHKTALNAFLWHNELLND